MKKLILLSLLMMILCVTGLGQKKTDNVKPKCAVGLDQAPELRGFRMGMTQAAALARLPGVTLEKPDKFGLARLRITIIDSTSLIKPSTKEKAAQADMTAGPNDGSAFVLDGTRFPALKGVRKMQMRFIDGRLSYVQAAYDNNIKWDSIDQFVETISTTLKLPKEWRAPADSDGGGHVKELRCEGFVITASTIGDYSDVNAGPELILQDLAAWEALSKRQNDITEKAKREEDEKRKAFKP